MGKHKHQAIIDLGRDLANGQTGNYSKEDMNDSIRKALLDIVGAENGKFSRKLFRRHEIEVYEIIEEAIDQRLQTDVRNQFEPYVDFRNPALGDGYKFTVKNDELLEVSMIAAGTQNLQRQRLENGRSFEISTDWYGVKIYEEFERFMTGMVDWVEMINTIARSFDQYIMLMIYTAIRSAYNGLTAPYKVTGSWDIDEFNDLVMHVEAATGQRPMVLGTRKALSKAIPAYVNIGSGQVDDRNRDGYFRTIDGTTLMELRQGHIPGTDQFAIEDDFLLVIPNGEKVIKFIDEGETWIHETGGGQNQDDSKEYTVRRKMGVAAVTNAKYGVYILAD